MLELGILGFLAGNPMHAYELRRRITALTGHARDISDGALLPALRRLEAEGHLAKRREAGQGGPARMVFQLTDSGRTELRRRLSEPDTLDITDRSRFFILLAFLHHLDDRASQRAVLERRLAILDDPGRAFFTDDEQAPTGEAGISRKGMLTVAIGIRRTEHDWLRTTVTTLQC